MPAPTPTPDCHWWWVHRYLPHTKPATGKEGPSAQLWHLCLSMYLLCSNHHHSSSRIGWSGCAWVCGSVGGQPHAHVPCSSSVEQPTSSDRTSCCPPPPPPPFMWGGGEGGGGWHASDSRVFAALQFLLHFGRRLCPHQSTAVAPSGPALLRPTRKQNCGTASKWILLRHGDRSLPRLSGAVSPRRSVKLCRFTGESVARHWSMLGPFRLRQPKLASTSWGAAVWRPTHGPPFRVGYIGHILGHCYRSSCPGCVCQCATGDRSPSLPPLVDDLCRIIGLTPSHTYKYFAASARLGFNEPMPYTLLTRSRIKMLIASPDLHILLPTKETNKRYPKPLSPS